MATFKAMVNSARPFLLHMDLLGQLSQSSLLKENEPMSPCIPMASLKPQWVQDRSP
jgi:hypothetical protein